MTARITIDVADGKYVTGWAFDQDDPDFKLLVEITSTDGFVTYCRADMFRSDLRDAGIGSGHHAFAVEIVGDVFSDDRLTATAYARNGTTVSRDAFVPPPEGDDKLDRYLRGRDWALDYQALMGRALKKFAAPAAASGATAALSARTGRYASRATPDKLFAIPPELAETGSNLISSFVAYELYRTRMDEHIDLRGDIVNQVEALVGWYLTSYQEHRKHKLPLSAAQIEFLNAPMPMLRVPAKVSVAVTNLIRRDLSAEWNLSDPAAVIQAIYWWCIERAPQLNLQDSLIPDSCVDLLVKTGAAQRWQKFHANTFVERFHAMHQNLHFLDITKTRDRAFLMAYMVTVCAQTPSLVRFMPREAVSRLLGPAQHGSDVMLLDHILQLALDKPGRADADAGAMPLAETATAARTAMLEAISKAGYSLKLGRRVAREEGGNSAECLDDRGIPDAPEPGLAVIGPMRAASGLGQATRISASVLRFSDLDVVTHDFDMDNPAPTVFMGEETAQDFPCRSINLIHLNAESIPLAFAFLPQNSYRHSYNIGFFFWELTKLPKCHQLALQMLDEIWVSSEYDREIYAANTDIPVINVGMAVLPLPELPPISRVHFGIPQDKFVFLTTFDSFSFVERKNPLSVVQAFQLAFPAGQDDVMLVLKTQNRHKVDDLHQRRLWNRISALCDQDSRIVVMNDTLQYAELLALKQDVDCYVSLHRSEGWGFGMVEAMQLGVPVIATGYSGNMEFCRPDTALLVGYKLVEPRPSEYIFVERGSLWADPSLDDAAAHMRTAFTDRAGTRAMAERAKDLVASSFSVEAISRRYAARLTEMSRLIPPVPES